jgi:hypothetical protein
MRPYYEGSWREAAAKVWGDADGGGEMAAATAATRVEGVCGGTRRARGEEGVEIERR